MTRAERVVALRRSLARADDDRDVYEVAADAIEVKLDDGSVYLITIEELQGPKAQ